VVMHSDTIGIACNANLRPYQRDGGLVKLQLADLTPEQEEACHTRYGVVSRVGYGLSPLAQGLVRQLIACDSEM